MKTLSTETPTETAAAPNVPAAFASDCGPVVGAIVGVIDDAKGEDIIALDLAGKTTLADAMIVASGRSDRHVGAIAERIASTLKEMGQPTPKIEGMQSCDWVLIDTGDVIVHLFRPEVRSFYNLEKLWGTGRPSETPVVESARPRRVATIKAEGAPVKPRGRRKPDQASV